MASCPIENIWLKKTLINNYKCDPRLLQFYHSFYGGFTEGKDEQNFQLELCLQLSIAERILMCRE
uniref:Uncharacterized protein n=1 Tax=Rhizophora mucronata TaxID=61149 RepID=A0A2P2J7S9_RHIMU